MKFIYLSLILLIATIVSAQDINQVDANGERQGVWRKNFDKTKVLRYEGEFSHGKEIGLFKFYKNINGKAVCRPGRLPGGFDQETSETDSRFHLSESWKYVHSKAN